MLVSWLGVVAERGGVGGERPVMYSDRELISQSFGVSQSLAYEYLNEIRDIRP